MDLSSTRKVSGQKWNYLILGTLGNFSRREENKPDRIESYSTSGHLSDMGRIICWKKNHNCKILTLLQKIQDFQFIYLSGFIIHTFPPINFIPEVEITSVSYLKCLSLSLAAENIIADFNISHLPIKWKCHIYHNIYLILNDISSVFSHHTHNIHF